MGGHDGTLYGNSHSGNAQDTNGGLHGGTAPLALRRRPGGTVLAMASPGIAADVTPERLLNPNGEPQNWLMNHRTYDGQRFSPLAGAIW
jgi:hypothetical protein